MGIPNQRQKRMKRQNPNVRYNMVCIVHMAQCKRVDKISKKNLEGRRRVDTTGGTTDLTCVAVQMEEPQGGTGYRS